MVHLVDKCFVCSEPYTDHPFPSLSPSARIFLFLRCNNIEIRAVNNPTIACKYSGERKSHMSLTLNKNLKMTELSEEGMSKPR